MSTDSAGRVPGGAGLPEHCVFNAVIEGELAWARVGEHRRLSNGESVLAGTIFALLPSVATGPAIDTPDVRRSQ